MDPSWYNDDWLSSSWSPRLQRSENWSAAGLSQEHNQQPSTAGTAATPVHAFPEDHHSSSGPAADNEDADRQTRLQAPSQGGDPLPVNALVTTILLVPEAIRLSARDGAAGKDEVDFRAHYLVPPLRRKEELKWTREFVTHEIASIMLDEDNWNSFMLNLGGVRHRIDKSKELEIGYLCPPTEQVPWSDDGTTVIPSYDEWAKKHISVWEVKFAMFRDGRRGTMWSHVLTDLHATNRQTASTTIANYIVQDGTVYTEKFVASQAWTRERRGDTQWGTTQRKAPCLFGKDCTMPAPEQHLLTPQRSLESLLAESHSRTLVVKTDSPHGSSSMTYHMLLAPSPRSELDDYIRQRSVVVDKLRHVRNYMTQNHGPQWPLNYLKDVLARVDTDDGWIALVDSNLAEEVMDEADDHRQLVITGEVEVRIPVNSVASKLTLGTSC